jgi:hypothetical protein
VATALALAPRSGPTTTTSSAPVLPPGPPTLCNAGSNASQTPEAALPAEEEAAAW